MKDLFSDAADAYQKYRPAYPDTLFSFIETLPVEHKRCWDCATGNGQLAYPLSNIFDQVYASDISEKQLLEATPGSEINFSRQPGERTNYPDRYFDLITIGQAIHWLEFDQFYKEVSRVTKPNAYLLVIGYGLIQNEILQHILTQLYFDILGDFWEPERKYIDEAYKTIPFPFAETQVPSLRIDVEWSREELVGYLQTWSALRTFRQKTGNDPLQSIRSELNKSIADEPMTFTFRCYFGVVK